MNRKTLVIVGVPVILLFAAACEQQERPDVVYERPAEEAPAKAVLQPPAATMRATVEGAGAEGENVRGNVEFLGDATGGDSFLLAVTLEGVQPGEHGWHIHRGKCNAANAPVALALSPAGNQPGLTGPLTAAGDGTVNSTVAIPFTDFTTEQLRSGDYSLRIHSRAGPDQGPMIACADL